MTRQPELRPFCGRRWLYSRVHVQTSQVSLRSARFSATTSTKTIHQNKTSCFSVLSRLVTQRKCTRVSGFSRAQVARRSARHTAILVRTWAWSGRAHGRSFLLRSHLFHPSTLAPVPSEDSSPCHRLPPDNWMDCKGRLVQLVEERERERAADGGRRRWAAWPHFRLV